MRTKDLADAVGVSVQQVRNYEASGFIPAVERSPSGYRLYGPQHLAALITARQLVGCYGVPAAQAMMAAVHQGRLAAALATIDQQHTALDHARQQLRQTVEMLNYVATQTVEELGVRRGAQLRIGEAARLVGLPISTLRYWEREGLLQPVRRHDNRYRLYDQQQLRRLRIVLLLRQAHYSFAAIATTLDELADGEPQRVIAAIEGRRVTLARRSWLSLAALAGFHRYISDYFDAAELLERYPVEPAGDGLWGRRH